MKLELRAGLLYVLCSDFILILFHFIVYQRAERHRSQRYCQKLHVQITHRNLQGSRGPQRYTKQHESLIHTSVQHNASVCGHCGSEGRRGCRSGRQVQHPDGLMDEAVSQSAGFGPEVLQSPS